MASVPEPASSPAEDVSTAEADTGVETGSTVEPAVTPGNAGEPKGDAAHGGAGGAQLPWGGKARKADIICWAGITLSGIYYLCLLPFRAALVGTHPILLEVLNGSTEAIVAAAAFARVGHGSLLVVMLASIPGLMKFDPLFWWAGRLWGERIIDLMFSRRRGRSRRASRYMEWVDRRGRWVLWPAVILAPFLPIPSALIYVIAGSSGMSIITFIVLDIIGSLMWAGMLAGLGYELGHHAVVVAQTISRYGLWFSLAILALIIFGQVRRARAMRSAGPG
jgi:membrane protein DedA with SNARE-associated domain